MKDDEVDGWKRTAAKSSLLITGIVDFAIMTLRKSFQEGAITDDDIILMRAEALRNIKNFEFIGSAIEAEAEILRECLDNLEKSFDLIVFRARQNV